MSKRGSGLMWVAIVLVVLLVAGVGGYFGYGAWADKRAKSAVEAAASYDEAMLTQDSATLEDTLPQELVAEMSASDIDAIAGNQDSDHWVFEDQEWDADDLVARYSLEQSDGSPLELEVIYTLKSGSSAKNATVKSETTLSADYIEEPTTDPARTDLVWLDGSWRVARYRWEGENEFERTFYREGRSAKRVLDTIRKDLGIERGSTKDGATDLGPAEIVTAHFEAILQGDYAAAYAYLPEATRTAAGDAETWSTQIAGYDVTAYKITDTSVDSSDGTTVVNVTMTASDMDIGYEWRFKQQGGSWIAVSRAIAGAEGSASPPLAPEQLNSGELPGGHPAIGTTD